MSAISSCFAALSSLSAGTPLAAVAEPLAALSLARHQADTHGDLPRWQAAVSALSGLSPSVVDLTADTLHWGTPDDLPATLTPEALRQTLMQLHPWRKGPFAVFGTVIDTEWRSDWKWQRVQPHLSPLRGRRVLDVGCGSGYHLWRMLGEGAALAIGIEPMLLYVEQFRLFRQWQPAAPALVLPLTLEDMTPYQQPAFDTVFSMGVLYHRREPLAHLQELKSWLAPGGELVLETLVIPDGDISSGDLSGDDLFGNDNRELVLPGRYARMRNIWSLPTVARLQQWLGEAGFDNVRLVDLNRTSVEEQRRTPWMTFDSLADCLDPEDSSRTVEGHPAPLRATLLAES